MSKTTGDASIGRASAFLASGTVVSRILGFVKAIVLAQTIGVIGSASADSFAAANQLPNTLYVIIAGGVLGAILVPQIVRATLHADRGQAYINKLLTLTFIVLLGATAVAMAIAPLLVRLFAVHWSSEQLALATAFAYWCLPQIFFYGLYSVLGEVLNAHKLFGPFTWSPVLNNIVAMAGLVGFILLFGADAAGDRLVTDWTPGMIAVLGGTATLGVASQALILFFFWRRVGLRYRPDFHWRGVGLRATGKLAGWSFAMIIATQLAGLVQSNVAAVASGGDASIAALQNAWLVFMLPHSVITVSLTTAYFTRLAEHVNHGRTEELKSDVSAATRQVSLLIVLSAAVLLVVAMPFASLFTENTGQTDAMGWVIIGYVVGLVPFCILFVLQRTFYAMDDTRTPFVFTLFQVVVFCALAFACLALPTSLIGVGLAVSMSVSIVAQLVLAVVLLRRRLRGLDLGHIVRSLIRFTVAAAPATVAGALVIWLLGGYTGGWAVASAVNAILTMLLGGLVMAPLYLGALWLLRSSELREALVPARRILGRFRR